MTHTQTILSTLTKIGQGTCMEIAAYNCLTYYQVLARMREMERAGLVYNTRKKGNTPKKVCAIVWGLKREPMSTITTLFDNQNK